jgi:prepilin-type N-terminal cleavage/methylation domain-containing protein
MVINLKKINKSAGFSFVELLVAIAIFGILVTGVTFIVTNSFSNFYGVGDKQMLTEFAQEAVEAVRYIQNNSWQDIENATSAGNQGISKNANGIWQFSGSDNTLGPLTRTISIINASRDGDGNIVDVGGTNDPNTKQVTVTVSGEGVADYVLVTYITSWSHNTWQQTDWSGDSGREFWSDETMFYTDTDVKIWDPGQITLANRVGYINWDNLGADAVEDLTDYGYSIELSADQNTIYVCGNDGSQDLQAYDITNVRSGTITNLWTVSLDDMGGCLSMAIHSSGDYMYLGNSSDQFGDYGIAVVDLGGKSPSIDNYAPSTTTSNFMGNNDLIIDDQDEYLYALSANGDIFVYAIEDGGQTLTTLGGGQKFVDDRFPELNRGWLDNDTEDLYIVSDDYDNAFMRVDTTDKENLSVDYAVASSYDYLDIRFLENENDKNRFIISTRDSSKEFRIIEDQGSSLTELSTYNLDGSTSVAHDTNSLAFMYDYDANIYSINISNRTSLSDGPVEDTSTYGYVPMADIYGVMEYSTVHGGIFILERTAASEAKLNFIMRSEGTSAYYVESGNIISSIVDLGANDKELMNVAIEQNVPTDCELSVTLDVDDNDSFDSPTSAVFSNTSQTYFTSSTPANLNGQRWLRYQVDMEACTVSQENDTTPTLYSFRLIYK